MLRKSRKLFAYVFGGFSLRHEPWFDLVVMSSSWNFPSWAKPSWKGSEPSRAELGHFKFRAERELTNVYQLSSGKFRPYNQISPFCSLNMILINFMIIYLNLLAQKVILELNNNWPKSSGLFGLIGSPCLLSTISF